jgi:copper transport protein
MCCVIKTRTTKPIWQRGLIIALCAFCTASAARAHATLLQTDPPANSRLEQGPSRIALSFNERIEAVFNSIEVLNEKGERVDDGNPQLAGDGDVLVIPLHGLTAGGYIVSWRVVSLDSHQVQGHFGFGIRTAAPSEGEMSLLVNGRESTASQLSTPIIRWISLAGMTVWLGGVGFWLWIFRPAVAMARHSTSHATLRIRSADERIRKIALIGAFAFLVSQCVALVNQAAIFTGLSSFRATSPLTIWAVIETTNYGVWWGVRMLASVVLLAHCIWGLRFRASLADTKSPFARREALLAISWAVLGGMVLISIPLTGHARAVPRVTVLAIASDWAHLAATAIWIGGLVFLLAVISMLNGNEGEEFDLRKNLISRFSRSAKICVAVLLLTGIYAAWLHLPTWMSFLSTRYGQVLSMKLALVGPILLIGLLNWRRVLPALARYSQDPTLALKWTHRFRSLLKSETILGGTVLLAVAFLTGLPPATAVGRNGAVNITQHNDDAGMSITLRLDSGQAGTRHAVVTLADSAGRRVRDAKKVTLYLKMLDMDMGLTTVPAQPAADGSYQADLPLSMSGQWRVSVEVSPARGDAFVTEFKLSSGL